MDARAQNQGDLKIIGARRASAVSVSLSMLILILALSACGKLPQTSTEDIIEGNQFFMKSEYEKAETCYRAALSKSPDNATAMNNLGVILNELGKYDEAITISQKAISADAKNPIAHYVLARALNAKGQFDEAFEQAKTATELDSTDAIGFRTLGEAALGRKDAGTAISAFEAAIMLDDTSDITHHMLGQAFLLLDDIESQILEDRRAVEINPNNIEARLSLADSLARTGRVDEACEQLNSILEKDSKNERALVLLKEFNQRN